jgi:quercetin dioxygenase-like cupin family protein
MKRLAVVVALCALAPSVYAAGAAKKPGGEREAVFLKADEIKWGDAPPQLPRGGQIAVLHGDPTKPSQFVIRLKAPDGYRIPPHWHSRDEQITVVAGTLVLHMGDTMEAAGHDLDAGSFHFLPGRMHHSAEAKGETVVQISGTGPFDIHYLNPADDPSKASAEGAKPAPRRAAGRRP